MVVRDGRIAGSGQDPDSAMGCAPAPPRRTLSAEDIGRRLEKSARAVRKWTEPGKGSWGADVCPCDRRMKGKQELLRFDLDEVIEWCTRVGVSLEAFRTVGAAQRMFGLRGEEISSGDSPAGPTAEELLADVPLGAERAAFRATLADLRRQVSEIQALLRSKNAAGLSHGQIKGLTDAAAKASQEIRQLDDAELLLRTRRGELVEKAPQRRAWGDLAGDFVALLTRLEVDVGASVKMELAAHECLSPEAAGEGEKVERIVRAVVRRHADNERARLAAALLESAEGRTTIETKEAA
jgi:hypothetical protein